MNKLLYETEQFLAVERFGDKRLNADGKKTFAIQR